MHTVSCVEIRIRAVVIFVQMSKCFNYCHPYSQTCQAIQTDFGKRLTSVAKQRHS